MQISDVSSDHSGKTDISANNDDDKTCSAIHKLEKLVTDVVNMAPMISPDIVQNLRDLIPTFPSRLNEDQRSRIWKLSRRIWNTCVEINNLQRAACADKDATASVLNEDHARLRHVSCDLFLVAGAVGSVHSSLLQTAMFFYKTGTVWHNLQNHAMATACFEKATELGNRARDHHEGSTLSLAQTEEEEKFLFDLYIARARTAWELQQKTLARSLLGRARGLLRLLTSATSTNSAEMYQTLAKDCLHYGKWLLMRSDKASYAESIGFLEQAYEICSHGVVALEPAISNEIAGKEAKLLNILKFDILRFLAAGHLHNENFENVLKCVEVLKTGPDHACISYLALKAYLGLSRFEEAEKELYLLVGQKFSTAKICAGAICSFIESCISSSRPFMQEAIRKAFSIVRVRFPSSKEFIVSILENLLTASSSQQFTKRIETALIIATDEDVVHTLVELSSSYKAHQLDDSDEDHGNAHRSVYCHLWNSAQECFQGKDYTVAIKLFEAALMYISSNDADYAQRRAKNLRILCISHLAVREYDRASDYADEANKIEPNIVGAFLKFKICLQTNDEDGATKQVEQMFKCPDFEPDYLTLASHEAISCKCVDVAITVLSRMLEMPSSSVLDTRKVAVIIRNIVALSAQESKNASTVLKYLKFARSRLAEVGRDRFFGSGSMAEKEAEWYAGTSWNHGLDTAQSQKWNFCVEFFKCAADFYELLPETLENLELRRASMLLAVSAALIDGGKDDIDNNAAIKEAALYLEKCRKVHQNTASKMPGSGAHDMTEIHISLISFEVKRRLKDYKGQLDIIRHCSTLRGFQPKYFFSIGWTIYEGENGSNEAAMAAFEAGLNMTLSSPRPDYGLVAATIRLLIKLAESDKRDGPQVMSFYRQAHQILLGLARDVYPKEEIQWLISTAWNRGSLHAKFQRFAQAEKWMSVALDMVKHAPAMEIYRSLMMDNLTLILKRKADEPTPMDE